MELDKKTSLEDNTTALDSDTPITELDVIDNNHRPNISDNQINSCLPTTTTDDLCCPVVIPKNEDNPGSLVWEQEENDGIGNFESDNDDFGSFDDNDDEFGSFDDGDDSFTTPQFEQKEQNIADNTPIFNTLEEALGVWDNVLNQIYHCRPLENYTENASKSIRHYVLEEAPESLHSRLTWDSVTRYMDNDTGIPKVRWYQSEVEKMHLDALSCKRSDIKMPAPTMLDTIPGNRPEPIDTSWTHSDIVLANYQPSPITTEHSNPTTPTSEKRSSLFGLSSLSRYLPHLSKSNLPRTPTSPLSPNHTNKSSSVDLTGHPLPPSLPLSSSENISNGMNSSPGAINNMNIQTKVSSKGNSTSNTNIKRSNTVAFSSRRFKGSAIFDISSSPPHSSTMSSSTTTKPRSISFHHSQQQSMDLFDFNVEPEHILKSPTTATEFNTSFKPLIPTTSLSPTICNSPSTITSPIVVDNDTFSGFHSVQQQDDDDPFGDFFTTTQTSKSSPSVKKTIENEDDPFGLNSIMQMSTSNIKTKNIPVSTLLTPTILSPKNATPVTNHDARLASMFEIPTATVSDQTEDDDWGDWTF